MTEILHKVMASGTSTLETLSERGEFTTPLKKPQLQKKKKIVQLTLLKLYF